MISWSRSKAVAVKTAVLLAVRFSLELIPGPLLGVPKVIFSFLLRRAGNATPALPGWLNVGLLAACLEVLSGNRTRITNECVLLLPRHPLWCCLYNARLSHWPSRENRCLLLFKIPLCSKCDKEDKRFLHLRPLVQEGRQQSKFAGLLLQFCFRSCLFRFRLDWFVTYWTWIKLRFAFSSISMLYTIYSSLNQLQTRLLAKLVDLFVVVLRSLCALCEPVPAQWMACASLGLPEVRRLSRPLNPAHPQAQPDSFPKAPAQLGSAAAVRRGEDVMSRLAGTSWDQPENLQLMMWVSALWLLLQFAVVSGRSLHIWGGHSLPAAGEGLIFSRAC